MLKKCSLQSYLSNKKYISNKKNKKQAMYKSRYRFKNSNVYVHIKLI